MAKRKLPKQTQKGRRGSRSVKRASSVQAGNFTGISGEVNIAGRDLIKKTEIIHQRALTAAEEAKKARSIETRLLAEGIGKYANGLKDRITDKSDSYTPYRGLLDYRLEDTQNFFGRDEAIKQTVEIISKSAFSVLHAESGAGKTSLLQAGVMPAILASGHLPLYLRPYDKNPEDTIKGILLPDSEFTTGLIKEPLTDFLRRVANILGAKTALVIILDQFEEFFYRVQEPDRNSFIDSLAECVNNPSLNVRWLFCLRKEYFSDLTAFRPGIPDPFENAFYLQPMSRTEAEDAIAKPARLKKIGFEKGLIAELLNDLGKERILPPHIQLVCSALVENLHGKQTMFARADYVKLGKAQGILKNHLDRVLTEKVPKDRVAVCQQVLEGLVTSTQQRVIKTEQELFTALGSFPEEQVRDAISLLAINRLLRGEDTDKGPAYELAHDILLDEIKLNPEIVKRKEAEELLEQGTRNLKRYGVLLNSDTLSIIGKSKSNLQYTVDVLCLLLLSLVDVKKHNQDWRFYLLKARQKNHRTEIAEALNFLLSHPNQKVRNNAKYALWNFLVASPSSTRPKIILWNLGRRTPNVFRQTVIYGFIALLTYSLTWVISRDFLEDLGWQQTASLSPGCIAETPSETPFITADPLDSSRIVVYGKSQGYVCQSIDAGETWESMSSGLPGDIKITSIDIRKDLSILISPSEMFLWDHKLKSWKTAAFNIDSDNEIRAISIGRKDGTIFIGLSPLKIVAIQTNGKCQSNIKRQDCQSSIETSAFSGEINFLETNEKYIVVNTDTGTWFSQIDELSWEEQAELDESISSFSLQTQSLPTDGYFVVVFTNGTIKRGELDREGFYTDNEWPFPSTNGDKVWDWPANTIYIAESDYVHFAVTKDDIQLYPGWSIFDDEWWRLTLERLSSK